jgi:hypothetical protein
VFTILLDEQLTGFLGYFRALATSEDWNSLAELLGVRIVDFNDVGLATGTSDRDLWLFCQSRRLYLLTDNRNAGGSDSLELTIREFNTATSLPVFTVSDRDRLTNERSYSERVIESLFERLIDAENLMGAGRLYLP